MLRALVPSLTLERIEKIQKNRTHFAASKTATRAKSRIKRSKELEKLAAALLSSNDTNFLQQVKDILNKNKI